MLTNLNGKLKYSVMYTDTKGQRTETCKTYRSKETALKDALKLKANGCTSIFIDGHNSDNDLIFYQAI